MVLNQRVKPMTPEQLWDVYREAVGGKAYNGEDLPEFKDAVPSAMKGWRAVNEFINEYFFIQIDRHNQYPP